MALAEALRRLDPTSATTVLIDGRSGSGKSTLATQLSSEWPDSIVVRLDDVYPGWDGLAWAAEHILSALLRPRSEGRQGRWRSWNWPEQRPGVWHTVEAGRRLVVEGVGALTPQTRPLADLAIWVDADEAERKRRALRRDGETYVPHWDRWSAQEEDFIARYDPRGNADLIARPVADGFGLTAAERTP